MKILVVSNLYPPAVVGGYEVGCHSVVEYLRARGFDVHVLTSNYGGACPASPFVQRILRTESFKKKNKVAKIMGWLVRKRHNAKALRDTLARVKPNVVYAWNMGGIGLDLLAEIRKARTPLAICLADYWLAHWSGDIGARFRSFGRKRFEITADQLHFCSNFLMEQTLPALVYSGRASVIPWGIDIEKFPFHEKKKSAGRLLFVGQLVRHKGVVTAIEALGRLVAQDPNAPFTLTLAGGSAQPEYRQELQDLVARLGLLSRVKFLGALERDALAAVYREHDVQLFPSLWNEPFGLTMLEGMASGLAVVGTGSGGSGEVMRSDENSILHAKGDAEGCAEAILRLYEDPLLFRRICAEGRRTVESEYTIQRMGSACESALLSCLLSRGGA